ncbi:hypothetical protein ALC60_13709 [Trachymyrmex zeteki]|uniref:Double jelly roll-like domain-containing protein n=1 Tax=Mycetomoellerius zeteki TaxID=64791 RepID=A0A151WHG2_9HYME|nr:hypothetical protein ALC60_13709 [Trachymyrmex zeteki]
MIDILSITGEPIFDDRIVKIETHTYNPFANTTFGYSEIRIPIQQQDLYTLPCESFLYVEGNLTQRKDFNFCVPLSMLLGFCGDYQRLIVNVCHELILIRARNDNNCLVGNPVTESEIELFKVQWGMPHVTLNEINKLSMLQTLESGRYLSMSFRSWDLYEYPLLQNTTKHSWAVKTATQLEKPRYVIFALQTSRKNVMSQNGSVFDDCNLSNVKLYLNLTFHPEFDCKENVPSNTTAYCLIIHDRVVPYNPLTNVVRKIT